MINKTLRIYSFDTGKYTTLLIVTTKDDNASQHQQKVPESQF